MQLYRISVPDSPPASLAAAFCCSLFPSSTFHNPPKIYPNFCSFPAHIPFREFHRCGRGYRQVLQCQVQSPCSVFQLHQKPHALSIMVKIQVLFFINDFIQNNLTVMPVWYMSKSCPSAIASINPHSDSNTFQ